MVVRCAAVSVARPYHAVPVSFRVRSRFEPPLADRALPAFGPGACSGGYSIPPCPHVELIRPLTFPGEPPYEHAPLSPTPALLSAIGSLCIQLLPSTPSTVSASGPLGCFRGSITRPAHSLCTLHAVDHSTPAQHSLPAGRHPLLDRTRTYQVLFDQFPSVFLPTSSFPGLRVVPKDLRHKYIVKRRR